MSRKMNLGRGCFERRDDEPDVNEYASPPCYMHEVDPSYFGLAPSTRATSRRKPRGPKVIVNASVAIRALRDRIVARYEELRGG